MSFLEVANVGGEFMADSKIQRVHKIASRIWIENANERTFLDDDEVNNLCIKKEGNPLVVVEFMRNLSDDVLSRIVVLLGLEGVTLQKKQLLEIYNDHMLRMLMAYFQTDDGKLLEVSSKNEADLLINTCELMALSFIPNNHNCSIIPIMVVRRDGLILTNVDYLSSIRLIYRILGFV
jgi:hypothetical protein